MPTLVPRLTRSSIRLWGSTCMDPGKSMVLHELDRVEPFHVGDVHRSVRRTCTVKPGGVFPGFDSPTLKSVKYPRGKSDNSSLEF